jgi:ATP-dependent Clp protease protease subunit
MGAVLMCAGSNGKRTALKHSRIMLHQPYGGAGGQATDIQIMVNEVKKLKHELFEIIAYHSGQSYEKVKEDSDRDFWMTAAEGKAYGLVDEVLLTNPKCKR